MIVVNQEFHLWFLMMESIFPIKMLMRDYTMYTNFVIAKSSFEIYKRIFDALFFAKENLLNDLLGNLF